MAGGVIVDPKGGGGRAHLYEYRITPYFIFACVIGSLGGSLFGYDLGVSGGVTSMDDFLKEFFPGIYRRKQQHLNETDYCKYDNQILTLFTSSLYFAALVSTFGASHVTRNKGRRTSIICGSISFFLGAILNAAAQNIAMLIIGRILLGIGIGFGNQAVPLYLSEMAPAKIRGAINQLFQLTTCLGILIANFVNYGVERIHPWGWRLSLGLAAVPATIMFIGGVFLPETPNSLVEQGRLEEGRQVLERVRGTPKVEAEFQDLIDASLAAKAIKHPFRNLLKKKNRPSLIIGALGIPAFQQLTGMNSILFYAPVIFQSLGFGSGASLYSSAFTSAALVLATLISMAFVDKFGRRKFFLEAGTEMIFCLVAVAITLALKFGQGAVLPKGIGIFLVLVICIFVLAYGRSWGPLGWLVPSELFPLETRSAGQSVVVCVNMIFTALIAQCFLAALCHLKYGIFLLFAGLIVIMSTFIFFLLPETKQVAVAITLALKFGQGAVLPKGIGIFLVLMICIFVLAYGRSWGPLGWLVPSELFPLETRSAGQSVVVCVNMIFTALIAQCFLAALCHLKYGIFLLFAGLIVIMSTFIFFLLPETKQVPIEEIHFLWQNHWLWKRYCGSEEDEENRDHELKDATGSNF